MKLIKGLKKERRKRMENKKEVQSEWLLSFDKRHDKRKAMTSVVKELNRNSFLGGYVDAVDTPDESYEIRLKTTTYHPANDDEIECQMSRLFSKIYEDVETYKGGV